MIETKKLLVPVDFSDCSKAALAYAAHFGKALAVDSVDVMHVWQPPRFVGPDTRVQSTEGAELSLIEFVKTAAADSMKEFLTELEKAAAFEVRGRLETGIPDRRIIAIAETESYDLIIMGTHGEARSDKLGSTAQRVVRDAPCPTLTIRVPGSGHTVPPPPAE